MQRIITGVVAGGIFLALLLLGGAYFQILVALLVIIAMQELFRMYKLQVFSFEGILATLAALSLAFYTLFIHDVNRNGPFKREIFFC